MDQNIIHKVLTFKSGEFVFSARHDESTIGPRLIELDAMQRMIATLPVLPSLHAQFKGELVRKSIHGTAAIEGNTLNEEQVSEILEKGDAFVPVNDREREIANLAKAYERFASYPKSDSPVEISEDLIKEIHAIITDGLTAQGNIPGQYRNILVEVGDKDHGGKYTPPKILADIKTLMSAFISWMNSSTILQLHPLIRAALAHYHLGLIHPFRDGNGRTARLLEAMLISASGIKHIGNMLSNYYYKNIDDYYISFRNCETDRNHNVSPFLNFVTSGSKESLHALHGLISKDIKHLATSYHLGYLMENKQLSRRQHDLARVLLSSNTGINTTALMTSPIFRGLYNNVSEQTARRDINTLRGLNLLKKEGSLYRLNLDALDF